MFDLNGDDVSRLSDKDARELIRRLCVAELDRLGLPLSAITAGGHQDASDGGVDVRVALGATPLALDFIPRAQTIFQIKTSPMSVSRISEEMTLKGRLRPSIETHLARGGAYVICATNDNTADSGLEARRQAMKRAVTAGASTTCGYVEFYDASRISAWAERYPGVRAWILERVGRALNGWEPTGNWTRDVVQLDFVADDGIRVRHRTGTEPRGFSLIDGVQQIRDAVREPGSVVRIVGLSGTGKTRLCEALFDRAIGDSPLRASLAVYTDVGKSPSPPPAQVVDQLNACRQPAVLIIDNCSPSLHRVIARSCRQRSSTVSVVTVEYDISDDDAEHAEVFELLPASDEATREIIRRMAPELASEVVERIAMFSGGNGRIVRSLLRGIDRNHVLGVLSDGELVTRIIEQCKPHDPELQRVAEAAALFYSVDVKEPAREQSELIHIARLAAVEPKLALRNIEVLCERDVMQTRGHWRAVLPHALANRLASQALSRGTADEIVAALVARPDHRLLKSFCKRLQFLHVSPHARSIAEDWLSADGFLDRPFSKGSLALELLQRVAPVAPCAALNALEREACTSSPEQLAAMSVTSEWVDVLCHLAYEAENFRSAVRVLAAAAICESENNRALSATKALDSLFQWALSGTHAPVNERLCAIEGLLESPNESVQRVGFRLLGRLLHAGSISSYRSPGFGSHVRDYGVRPATLDDLAAWFLRVIDFVAQRARKVPHQADQLAAKLAQNLRGLWSIPGVRGHLEQQCREIGDRGFWAEGWSALRDVLRYDAVRYLPEELELVRRLASALAPTQVRDRISALISLRHPEDWASEAVDGKLVDDPQVEAHELECRVDECIDELAGQSGLVSEVLDMLLRSGNRSCVHLFSFRLMIKRPDRLHIWSIACDRFARFAPNARDPMALRGMLGGIAAASPEAIDAVLDALTEDRELAEYFPWLQCAVPLDEQAVRRLTRALALGMAPASAFHALGWGRCADGLADAAFCDLVRAVAEAPAGFDVAVDIAQMRLHAARERGSQPSDAVRSLARELLLQADFAHLHDIAGHHLGQLGAVAFAGEGGAGFADLFCAAMRLRVPFDGWFPYWANEVIGALLSAQPRIALDAILLCEQPRRIARLAGNRGNPVHSVSDDVLLDWAAQDPERRAWRLMVQIDALVAGPGRTLQLSTLATRLLELSGPRMDVLDALGSQFCLDSWSGSLATALQPYLDIARSLSVDSRPRVREWAESLSVRLEADIRRANERERLDRERFE